MAHDRQAVADWTFRDPELDFDSHVREQLPWYDVATELVADVARHFITPGSIVYDVGAATGNVARALADVVDERSVELRSIEPAAELADRYRGPGTVIRSSAVDVTFSPFSVAVSLLTLIFLTPVERRLVIGRLVDACEPGGAIVIVERMTPGAGYLGLVFGRTVLMQKLRHGADPAAALVKESALAGVQRPLDPDELPAPAVEFFRAADFAGFVWQKP